MAHTYCCRETPKAQSHSKKVSPPTVEPLTTPFQGPRLSLEIRINMRKNRQDDPFEQAMPSFACPVSVIPQTNAIEPRRRASTCVIIGRPCRDPSFPRTDRALGGRVALRCLRGWQHRPGASRYTAVRTRNNARLWRGIPLFGYNSIAALGHKNHKER